MDASTTLYVVLLLVAVLFSAFFSGSEAAFLSIQRGRLAHLVHRGTKGADKVAQIAGHPEKLLPTVLTGNNLANTAAAALGTTLAASFLSPNIAIIAATAGVTVLLLVVSETIPKTLATKNAERIATTMVGPLQLAEVLLFPAVWVLQKLSGTVGRLFGMSGAAMITEEEIRSLIDIGEAEGAVEPQEAEMLEKVFRFGDRQVQEVMTPRTEVVWVEKGTTLGQFFAIYAQHSHTRFPVYEENQDNVLGILSAKDVLAAVARGEPEESSQVTETVRSAFFVPEMKLMGDLFAELRQSGNQMAMVVDEFGGVAGLVTLKQLVEEIVGRVGEEGEAGEEPEVEAIDENTFQIDGSMRVDEANEQLGLGIPEGDYETVAGFVLRQLRHIPAEGEHLHHDGFRLEVSQMRGVKIEKLLITRTSAAPR